MLQRLPKYLQASDVDIFDPSRGVGPLLQMFQLQLRYWEFVGDDLQRTQTENELAKLEELLRREGQICSGVEQFSARHRPPTIPRDEFSVFVRDTRVCAYQGRRLRRARLDGVQICKAREKVSDGDLEFIERVRLPALRKRVGRLSALLAASPHHRDAPSWMDELELSRQVCNDLRTAGQGASDFFLLDAETARQLAKRASSQGRDNVASALQKYTPSEGASFDFAGRIISDRMWLLRREIRKHRPSNRQGKHATHAGLIADFCAMIVPEFGKPPSEKIYRGARQRVTHAELGTETAV